MTGRAGRGWSFPAVVAVAAAAGLAAEKDDVGKIRGVVRGADGKPAAGVTVEVLVERPMTEWGLSGRLPGSPAQTATRTTDEAGRFSYAADTRHGRAWKDEATVRIAAWTADRSLGASARRKAMIRKAVAKPFELRLAPTAKAEIRLVDSAGTGIAEVKLSALRIRMSEDRSGSSHFGMLVDPEVKAVHRGEGRYRLTGLLPGCPYCFNFVARGYRYRPASLRLVGPNHTAEAGGKIGLGTIRLERLAPKHIRMLLQALRDEDASKAEKAARGLGHLAGQLPHADESFRKAWKEEAVPALAKTLSRSGNYRPRRAAVVALGRSDDPDVIALLLPVLHDMHPDVRAAALRSLTRPAMVRAKPSLRRLEPLKRSVRNEQLYFPTIGLMKEPAWKRPSLAAARCLQPGTGAELARLLQEVYLGRTFPSRDKLLAWWWSFPLKKPAIERAGLSDREIAALWDRLAEPVGPRPVAAMRRLAAGGDEAVAFLTRRIRPLKVEEEKVAGWIADLDSASFAARREAYRRLRRLGDSIVKQLVAARRKAESAELQSRLERLIQDARKPYPTGPEQRRLARALRVLRLIGSERAAGLLETLKAAPALGARRPAGAD